MFRWIKKCITLENKTQSYYYQKGFNDGKNKFIIHFEGAE